MVVIKKIPLRFILLSGLLVGTLDILSAFADVYINAGKNPLIVLNYIATGAFGKTDFTASNGGALMGLLFHYFIAFTFTILFFWLYRLSNLLKKNWIITGVAYGLFIWAVMNVMVVPLSNVPHKPLSAMEFKKALKAALILICMIGLPLSFIAHRIINGPEK